MELLPFVDILKVFNNPISEEQAWAVCYQCAHFLHENPKQEFYQDIYDYGIHSLWLSKHGDVLLRKGPPEPNGSGKGPPHNSHSHHSPSTSHHTVLPRRKRHVIATETDAVQALGAAIFEALDYGIDASEERQLSHGLESLIVTMTNADNSLEYDPEAPNADDEGIEKDADIEHRCTVQDVLKMCRQHLSSKQDALHHYRAVCRALATEAGELFTFLEKISTGKEKLMKVDEEDKRLEELQRADWACLWVQVMRSLRQGVRLKKVEHIHLPPLEYELTPFEMLLEDIRSRRYTLHKIMVNGEIPHKVKNDAHAVILDFIRSRPPLKKVDDRKLKPKPPSPPDPHELLLNDIRARPRLKPVKHGKLVVESPRSRLSSDEDKSESSQPTKRVIKPDFNLLLNNSFEESSEDEDSSRGPSLASSPHTLSSPASGNMTPPTSSWQRAVTRDALLHDSKSQRPSRLQRRHTIMVCEAPADGKVAAQELPPLEEEEEPSPVRESHLFSQPLPLSRAQGAALLNRTSYSDHDLSSQVVMRHPQGHGRRASLEHRRSLSSLTTGLCAIPEMDDNPGGADSPTRQPGPVRRSWSHEQAPPPNPSPPCKGRARAALGMGMAGMKPVGGPYHPGTHRQHAHVSSSLASSVSPHGMTPDSVHSSSSVSSTPPQRALQSSSTHAATISPSSSSPSSSSAPASPTSSQHASLDLAVSSQSPGYVKGQQLSQAAASRNAVLTTGSSNFERRIGRWRHPRAREERMNNRRQPRIAEGPENHSDSVYDGEKRTCQPQGGETRTRRLSLDSGVSVYTDTHDLNTGVNIDQDSAVSRRLSMGAQNRSRGGVVRTAGKVKSSEDAEKIARWRTLQEDELSSRTRRVGKDMTDQPAVKLADQPEHEPQTQNGPSLSGKNASPESTDVLQQKMADEEIRFARWRRLEETGGHKLTTSNDVSKTPPSPDSDHVSHDIQSVRLQPPAAPDSLNASAFSSLQGATPLPKRWQNPVECLSLTLEEVTHIRSVLTKAELESLISHPDLYQQVSKSKLCFTCKTTRFTLFGEWGTKCKFCKRTVCSKCLRKMNVPTDHFRNIPVYTLSPTPLTQEMQEMIQNFIRNAPPVSLPPTRDVSPTRQTSPPSPLPQLQRHSRAETSSTVEEEGSPQTLASKGLFSKSKQPLHRSQSLLVSGQKQGPLTCRTIKGPVMAICCDCKGMVMEIIRASRASLTMLSATTSSAASTSASQLSMSDVLRQTAMN